VSYAACIEYGTRAIPHPQKAYKGGEDSSFAYAIQDGTDSNILVTLGVADGVSGWASDGVDPALYSRQLSEHGYVAACATPIFKSDPKAILEYAHANAKVLGSSTLTILTIESGIESSNGSTTAATLRSSNVGDSGFKVIRGGSIVLSSGVMEHYFNCPMQLADPGLVPDADTPSCAQSLSFDLIKGDVIVLATDGVFDNIFDEDLVKLCQMAMARPNPQGASRAEALASDIAEAAAGKAKDPTYESPFSKEAFEREKKMQTFSAVLSMFDQSNPYTGGKLDDVTCVVATVN